MTQQATTIESIAELWRIAAASQKKAESASRDAAQAAAKARDALLEFCIENGVEIRIESK